MPILVGPYGSRVVSTRRYPDYDEGNSGPLVLPPDALDGPGTPVFRPYYPEHWPLIQPDILEPDYLWSCQDASGNLLDNANSPAAELVARTNVNYQQTLTGWTQKFVGITAEASGSGFWSDAASLWNIGSQSIFVVLYAAALTSNGNRCLFLGGGGNGLQIEIVGTGQATSFVNSVRTTGTFVYASGTPTVYPFVYQWDRRDAGDARLYTNKEQILSTWANLGDNFAGLGSNNLAAPIARYGLVAVWVGANAEFMMDRGGSKLGGKTLITNLGWPMAY